MYPQLASNNPYFSLGNCCYFFQTPYFQPNFNFNQFSSPTLVSKGEYEGFKPFLVQQDVNKNKTMIQNIFFSPSTNKDP